jgi:hypothetical protein
MKGYWGKPEASGGDFLGQAVELASRGAGRRGASDRAVGSRSASVVQQMIEPAAELGLIEARTFLPRPGLLALGGALGGFTPPPRG